MQKSMGKVIPINPAKAAIYNAEEERLQQIIGQRITLAREMKRISVKELQRKLKERSVDVGYTTLFRWEKGETEPSAYQLLAICDALEIPDMYSFFMSGGKGQQLNDEGMKKLMEYRADLLATGKYTPIQKQAKPEIRYVEMPVSSLGASAGTGEFLSEDNIELMRFPEDKVPAKADFALRVVGDSMEPIYQDHQLVWVQSCNTLLPGEVGIFVLDGHGYIKAYAEQEPDEAEKDDYTDSNGVVHMQPVLISYNQKYEPKKVLQSARFKICGRVLN
ncbi:MAG: LexA family transcriptional regulator [Acidaminococcaceae bacterium]|nr:LexA family transcriptional regulator [Acidaminococcaceae bacterium]